MLVLVAAGSAYAEGPVLVRYEYSTFSNKASNVLKVEVGVDEEGVAEAKSYQLNTQTGKTSDTKTETTKLHGMTFKAIKTRLEPLYDANIEVYHRRITCKMMPRPSTRFRNLFVKKENSDEMRLVLSNEGCWLNNVTRPADKSYAEKARNLKVRLKNIGDELLGLSD